MNKRKGIQIEDLLSKFNELRKSTQVLCELHVNCVNIYKDFSVVLFFLKKVQSLIFWAPDATENNKNIKKG